LESKRAINPHTIHSPHGVDVDHFGAAADETTAIAPEISALQRPVIGFFGLIESWIDLDLVAHLARNRPNWSFVMIGRVAVPAEAVPQVPNLHFLGRRPYDALPSYGRGFDCCLIPYRLTQQVIHANPLKLREYLAMGKPIVSVSTPEIDQFGDVVAIAHSPEEFLSRLDAVVDRGDLPQDSARRRARVRSMSWKSRVEAVWACVSDRLENSSLAPGSTTATANMSSTRMVSRP
jgi:glycosyltransferase involved in cell wall biosynthesis